MKKALTHGLLAPGLEGTEDKMSQSSHERSFTSSLEPFTPCSGASGDFGNKRGRTELGAHNDPLRGPTQPTASALGQKKSLGRRKKRPCRTVGDKLGPHRPAPPFYRICSTRVITWKNMEPPTPHRPPQVGDLLPGSRWEQNTDSERVCSPASGAQEQEVHTEGD